MFISDVHVTVKFYATKNLQTPKNFFFYVFFFNNCNIVLNIKRIFKNGCKNNMGVERKNGMLLYL